MRKVNGIVPVNRYLIAVCFVFGLLSAFSQNHGVAVSEDGSAPDASAMFEVKSTAKGVLIPRLNFFEMSMITSPADGFVVAGLKVISPLVPAHILVTGVTDCNSNPATERGYACVRYETMAIT